MVRLKARFVGRVQGVGFRYTIAKIANQLGLTGWAKNEWDGSVKAEIQGEFGTIDCLIELLKEDKYIRIDRMELFNIPVVDGERCFTNISY